MSILLPNGNEMKNISSGSSRSTKNVAGDAKLGGLKKALDRLPFARTRLELSALDDAVKKSGEITLSAVSLLERQGPDLRSFKIIQSTADTGAIVREARKRMNYSQQRLADLAGVGRRFISELESGKPTLEFDRVAKVCAACGIDLFAKSRVEPR